MNLGLLYFTYGFVCAVALLCIIAYLGSKSNKNPDKPQQLTDTFRVKYYKGNDIFCSALQIDRYNHVIKGPMADDIYKWLTNRKEDEDA